MSDKYIVSARKYRPQDFSSVVGQDSIVKTLKNAIKNQKLAQAYLFSGPRGVGKTTCARIFAKTINCENLTPDVEACNQCESCQAFNNNTSYNIYEMDAASNNSVDDIRQLIEQVRIPPQIGRYKIYIIDEVHMLSQQAFNAFLKTLEEPPAHVIFILATTEKHKILPTILSRCQIFDFNRIKIDDIVNHLINIAKQENIQYEEDALTIIAQKADGGLRDALSIFDQIASYTNGNITYQATIENLNILDYGHYFDITQSLLKGDYAKVLLDFDNILEKGFSEANFFNGLATHFRNLLVLKNPGTEKLLEVGERIKEKYKIQSKEIPTAFIIKSLDVVNKVMVELKTTLNRRLASEMALVKMCFINQKLPTEQIETPTNISSSTIKQNTNKETKQVEYTTHKQETNKEVKEPASTNATYKPRVTGISIKETLSNSGEKYDDNKEEVTIVKEKQGSNINDNSVEVPTNHNPYFSETQFREAINLFFEENNLVSLRHTNMLISFLPDNTVKLIFPNSILEDKLKEYLSRLITYVQKKLQYNSIKIVTEIIEVKQEYKKPGQSKESIYENFVKKNPNLEKLREKFDLRF